MEVMEKADHTQAAVAAVPVRQDKTVQHQELNVELAEMELQHQ
jgi:hypothetical protein